MKILCVCDYGVNRSVHIAHVLKFRGNHDTLAVGINTSSPETIAMLADWADLVILTDDVQRVYLPVDTTNVWVWSLLDGAKRPFNAHQHKLVERYIDEYRARLIEMDERLRDGDLVRHNGK